MIKASAFIALEASLSKRLTEGYTRLTGKLFAQVHAALERKDFGTAATLVQSFSLQPLFDQNKDYIAMLTNMMMLFGASRVTPHAGRTSIGLGDGKEQKDLMLQWIEQMLGYRAEVHLKAQALQLIAEAKAQYGPETIHKDDGVRSKVRAYLASVGLTNVEKTGTSDGAIKAWETRRGGAAAEDAKKPKGMRDVYHGTAAAYVRDIIKHGLQPLKEKRVYTGPGYRGARLYQGERGHSVFVTPSKRDAQAYGESAAQFYWNKLPKDQRPRDPKQYFMGGDKDFPMDKAGNNPLLEVALLHYKIPKALATTRDLEDDIGKDRIGEMVKGGIPSKYLADYDIIKQVAYGKKPLAVEHHQVRKEEDDDLYMVVLCDPGEPVEKSGTSEGAIKAWETRRGGGGLPPEPGTAPIKEGYIRLYHQTGEQNVESIRNEGLTMAHAKGIEGPKAIYAAPTPYYGSATSMPTVEFQVPEKDYEGFIVHRDVTPKEIIAIHEPWHDQARYMVKNDLIGKALAGEYDDLGGDYAKAAQYIKEHYKAKKAEGDAPGAGDPRVTQDFASFMDDSGQAYFNMVSSLHTSRVSALGFTAEAEALGVNQYQISEQLDKRTCPVCEIMDGKVFDVSDARFSLDTLTRTTDPDELTAMNPWPGQDKASLEELAGMSDDELIQNGWNVPPYHPHCRGLLTRVGKGGPIGSGDQGQAEEQPYDATEEDFLYLSQGVSQDDIDTWNAVMGIAPAEVIAGLRGMSTDEYLTGLESGTIENGIDSLEFGNGSVNLALDGVAFDSMNPVLQNYIIDGNSLRIGYIELSDSDAQVMKDALRSVLMTANDIGVNEIRLTAGLDTGGWAWAKYGFTPTQAGWDILRSELTDKAANVEMTDDEATAVAVLLASPDPVSIQTLADLPVGERLLSGTEYDAVLNLNDPDSLSRFRAYVGS